MSCVASQGRGVLRRESCVESPAAVGKPLSESAVLKQEMIDAAVGIIIPVILSIKGSFRL
ncbi:MAG: hypothetical protein ACI9G1_000413 [Pirellulaceae bacterium]|jgi:hypothetical protein